MTKVVKTVVEEFENRPVLTNFYQNQNQFLTEMIEDGKNFEQFENFMNSAPEVPHYNFLFMTACARLGNKNQQSG